MLEISLLLQTWGKGVMGQKGKRTDGMRKNEMKNTSFIPLLQQTTCTVQAGTRHRQVPQISSDHFRRVMNTPLQRLSGLLDPPLIRFYSSTVTPVSSHAFFPSYKSSVNASVVVVLYLGSFLRGYSQVSWRQECALMNKTRLLDSSVQRHLHPPPLSHQCSPYRVFSWDEDEKTDWSVDVCLGLGKCKLEVSGKCFCKKSWRM